MPALKILQYPDPVLKEKSLEVTAVSEGLKDLIRDLVDTLRSGPGVGLAAPQVGILKRIIVVDVTSRAAGGGLIILINPVITASKGSKTVREGCLSIPEYTADVKRAEDVIVEGLDEEGGAVKIASTGLEAIALQHEIDHLDGVLFIDRIEGVKGLFKRKIRL
ncbi:MAG: peptide deformylase [Deltaproteobacteria bacterium]|nr:peptide deformylase [Deltaproteobacteria bacterium]